MKEIILHISAGQGPKECQWVVAKLADAFTKEGAKAGLKCYLIEPADDLAASLLLSVSGNGCDAFAKARIGTIRWIGQSIFRPKHKRKNWYVGVSIAPNIAETPDLKNSDISYQAIRASGPGGQHINKTDSAIRATHTPTGLSCVSQEQRSQFANKKIARLKLAMMIDERLREKAAQSKEITWQQNIQLERGNEARCYEGSRFKLRNGKPI